MDTTNNKQNSEFKNLTPEMRKKLINHLDYLQLRAELAIDIYLKCARYGNKKLN